MCQRGTFTVEIDTTEDRVGLHIDMSERLADFHALNVDRQRLSGRDIEGSFGVVEGEAGDLRLGVGGELACRPKRHDVVDPNLAPGAQRDFGGHAVKLFAEARQLNEPLAEGDAAVELGVRAARSGDDVGVGVDEAVELVERPGDERQDGCGAEIVRLKRSRKRLRFVETGSELGAPSHPRARLGFGEAVFLIEPQRDRRRLAVERDVDRALAVNSLSDMHVGESKSNLSVSVFVDIVNRRCRR